MGEQGIALERDGGRDLDRLVDFRAVLAVLFDEGYDLVEDDPVPSIELFVYASEGADLELVDLVDGGLEFGGRHPGHLFAREHARFRRVIPEAVGIPERWHVGFFSVRNEVESTESEPGRVD